MENFRRVNASVDRDAIADRLRNQLADRFGVRVKPYGESPTIISVARSRGSEAMTHAGARRYLMADIRMIRSPLADLGKPSFKSTTEVFGGRDASYKQAHFDADRRHRLNRPMIGHDGAHTRMSSSAFRGGYLETVRSRRPLSVEPYSVTRYEYRIGDRSEVLKVEEKTQAGTFVKLQITFPFRSHALPFVGMAVPASVQSNLPEHRRIKHKTHVLVSPRHHIVTEADLVSDNLYQGKFIKQAKGGVYLLVDSYIYSDGDRHLLLHTTDINRANWQAMQIAFEG